MNKTKYRFIIAAALITVIICRILFWKFLGDKFDETTVTLLLIALVISLIPIENIKSFKAGGVELELNYLQIKGAINSLDLNLSDNEKIEKFASSLSGEEIKSINGSKVLWIDDKPNNIIGERRLFRSFGLNITAVDSLEHLKRTLELDNDFDLIISDIQWRDKNNPKKLSYGGIDAVQFLRKEFKDKIINSTHVIFYTAYTESQIETIEKQTGFLQINNQSISHSILSLLETSVSKIVNYRQKPIIVNSKKKAT